MAEAFANQHGKGDAVALSAGVRTAERVNPIVIEVMKEKGIDISQNKPKLLTPQMVEEADQVISMGCGAEGICPAPLSKNMIDWELEDPKGKPIERVREIRDEIERRVLALVTKEKSNA